MTKAPTPERIVNPRTAEECALLYEAALREMEEHRDEMIAACSTLRRLIENERKIVAAERSGPPAETTAFARP